MTTMKERTQTAKTIFTSSIVIMVVGLVSNIFIKRSMPVLGATLKTFGFIIAICGMFIGALWVVAGDKLARMWSNKYNKPLDNPVAYYNPEATLTNELLETEIITQRLKREQMKNMIEMQKAKIANLKAKTTITNSHVKKQTSTNSAYGFNNLGDFMIGGTPKQPQKQHINLNKKKNRKAKKQSQTQKTEDDFFKW